MLARRAFLACLAFLPLALAACPTRPPRGPDAPLVPPQAQPPPLDVVTLTFIGTTDIHGHVEAETEHAPRGAGKDVDLVRGGLPLLAGYVANARAANPGRVVLLDSGDMMQGTLVSNLGEGRAVVKAMGAMGYAAAAVGNHEFDYGPVGPEVLVKRAGEDPRGALKARAAEARYPWLSANIVDEQGGPLAPAVRAFTVVEVDGVKVGIVGGTSEDTPHTTLAPNLVGLRVLPLAPSLAKAAAAAREAGATVVVAVVHEGGECRKNDRADDLDSCKDDAPIFQLARALPPGTVDAIFAGHTHQAVAHRVAGVPILQAWSNARAFSRLDLLVDRRSGRPVPGGARIFPPEDVCAAIVHGAGPCRDASVPRGESRPARYEGREVAPDAQVEAAFADDLALAAKKRAEPIGVTLQTKLHRAYDAESAIGNLAADALRRAAATDLGLMNGGGLRADLPAGELSFGALFEAFPFDNKLAVVKLPGAALRRLFERNLAGDKGVLSIAGATARASCQGGRLVVDVTLDSGRPLQDDATYTAGTIDFLARGGDGFTGATGGGGVDEAAPLLRDIMADELRRRGPRIEGDAAFYDRARPRLALPGRRPIRCAPTDATK